MSKSILVNGKVNGKTTGFNALSTLQAIIDFYKIADKKTLEECKIVIMDANLARFAKTSTSLVYPKVDQIKVRDRVVRVVGCVTGTSYNGEGDDELWKLVGLISQFFRCDKYGIWQSASESSLYASGPNFEKVRTYDYKKLCGVCDTLNGLEEFSLTSCPFKISDKVGEKKRTVEERVFLILKGMDKPMYSYLRCLMYDAATCGSGYAKDVDEQGTLFKCAFDTSARSSYVTSDPAKAYEYSSKSVFSNTFFKSNYFFGSVLKNRDKRTLETCLNIQSLIKYCGLSKGVIRVYGAVCNMTKLVRALTYAYSGMPIRFELEGNSENFGNCGSIPYAKEKCKMVINCKVYSSPKQGNINLINAHNLYAVDLKKYNSESNRVFSLISSINQLNIDEKCVPTFAPETGEAFMSTVERVGLDRNERAKLFTKACYLSNTSGVDLVPAFFKLRAFYNIHDCEMPNMVSSVKDEEYEFVDVSVKSDYNDVFKNSGSPALILKSDVEAKVSSTEIEIVRSTVIPTTATTSIEKVVEDKAAYPALDGTGFVLIKNGTGDEIAIAESVGIARIGEFRFELGQNGFKLNQGFLECVAGYGGELTKNKAGVYFVRNVKGKHKVDDGNGSASGTFEDDEVT